MALTTAPEGSKSVWNAIKGALNLFSDTNKAQSIGEVIPSIPVDEYESKMEDSEIVELMRRWKSDYSQYYGAIEKTQQTAFEYWIGKHRLDETQNLSKEGSNLTDNLIFEALETFLPIATRANPEPLVICDPSPIGQEIEHAVRNALVKEADNQKLRRKLAKMTRQWALNRLGATKVSWDVATKSIKTEVINAKRFIFDKDGYIDEGGNFIGEYIGEKKRTSANSLIEMFPKKKEIITMKAKGMMGTKLEYYEWWYKGDDVFYTLDDEVLGKYKNPNWNYDGETSEPDPETGIAVKGSVQGTNHHKKRMAPYVFLSVFSAGSHPHDDTSLILQNLSIQDMINRRWRQIDQNVDGMNNGLMVSGKSFTEETASQAASAMRRGKAIRVPDGNMDSVRRIPAPPLPSEVFNSVEDGRSELRNIFGTSGSTPQGVSEQKSVRGKIMVSQQDSSRIGGGITEQIEQVADTLFNWWVQMMFVYFDEEHFILTAGQAGGNELIILKNDRFPLLKSLEVTVKEGSLIPKDPLTQRNEAIDLWSANAIDPLTFYKKLDVPDPAQATQQLILWQMLQKGQISPQQYLPSFQIAQPEMEALPTQQPGTGGPAVNPPPAIPANISGAQAPALQSPPAVEAQGRQLLESIPIR